VTRRTSLPPVGFGFAFGAFSFLLEFADARFSAFALSLPSPALELLSLALASPTRFFPFKKFIRLLTGFSVFCQFLSFLCSAFLFLAARSNRPTFE
jgi:hypothetical protein